MEKNTKSEITAKKFNTLQEIFSDRQFKRLLKSELNKYRLKRQVLLPSGVKYKRTAYDTLNELLYFNEEYFIRQFPNIVLKKSNLSKSVRILIENMMNESIRKTLQYYNTTI